MSTESQNMNVVASLASIPSSEILPRAERRIFTLEYQDRILAEIDQAGHGKMGAILRREGLYSSQITKWRKRRRDALAAGKRGPKADPALPLRKENERLERKVKRLEERLAQARIIMEAQKKLSEVLGITLPEADNPTMSA